MADKSGIGWTDASWNASTGCDRCSPGCDHCYALTLAARLKRMGSEKYQVDGDPSTSGPGFAYQEHEDALDQPLRWTKSRMIFSNSMSDMFHKDATEGFIAKQFAVMAAATQHQFQVLTKRPQRMVKLLAETATIDEDGWHGFWWDQVMPAYKEIPDKWRKEYPSFRVCAGSCLLANVWLGTSIESGQYAFRADHLVKVPAAVRFLSMEPLLGPVTSLTLDGIDWVIIGGESGPGARRMDPSWARDIADLAKAQSCRVFVKQLGAVLASEVGVHGKGETDEAIAEALGAEYVLREFPITETAVSL